MMVEIFITNDEYSMPEEAGGSISKLEDSSNSLEDTSNNMIPNSMEDGRNFQSSSLVCCSIEFILEGYLLH